MRNARFRACWSINEHPQQAAYPDPARAASPGGGTVTLDSAAPAAQAEHVHAVRPHPEPSPRRKRGGGLLHGPLEPDRSRKVLHGAAGGADEMVMVLREVLGQLVPGEAAGPDQPPDDARLLQH